jgi:hypothetical protein
MLFPTWLDMILLLAAFIWNTWQQLEMVKHGSSSKIRLFADLFYIATMLVAVLYNKGNAEVSAGLFVVSLASLGFTYYLYRQTPPRLPKEPRL